MGAFASSKFALDKILIVFFAPAAEGAVSKLNLSFDIIKYSALPRLLNPQKNLTASDLKKIYVRLCRQRVH